MIFAASLAAPAKKALGKKVQQSTVNKIVSLLPIEPDTSTMDVVLLGPSDALGANKENLNKALANRHPGICTIYVCTKEADKDLLDCEYKFSAKKITPNVIREVIEDNVGAHKVQAGRMRVSTKDFEDPGTVDLSVAEDTSKPKKGFLFKKRNKPVKAREMMARNIMDDDFNDEDEDIDTEPGDDEFIDPDEFAKTQVVKEPEPEPVADPIVVPEEPTDDTAEEKVPLDTQEIVRETAAAPEPVKDNVVEKASSIADFDTFKELLRRNSIMNRLVHENSDYMNTLNMLEVLEKRIEEIYRDPTLDSTTKFERIRDIGLDRSVLQATNNSISTERVINIITTIANSAKRIVDEKIQSIDESLTKITVDRANLLDSVVIDKAIDKRTETYFELLNLGRSLVDLYQSMDTLVSDTINELDAKLPSKNEFINQMVKPIGPNIFTPTNSAELANALLQALSEKRIAFSQLEDHLKTTCELISQYFEQSNDIIMYQQQKLDLLRANRVEDVIIAPTALKRVLKLYIGDDNCGRSATAITWNGILSRRQNTLLIDLTGRNKFSTYGIDAVTYDEFMRTRIEKQFCCVYSDHILDSEELQKLLDELPLRLNYYANIGVILAPEDTAGLDYLSTEALTVHYITDCRTASMDVLADIVKKHTTPNIAHVLVTIDAPISPVSIADNLGLDLTNLKVVSIPSMQQIRACALRNDKPYEYTDVTRIFEGAFNL